MGHPQVTVLPEDTPLYRNVRGYASWLPAPTDEEYRVIWKHDSDPTVGERFRFDTGLRIFEVLDVTQASVLSTGYLAVDARPVESTEISAGMIRKGNLIEWEDNSRVTLGEFYFDRVDTVRGRVDSMKTVGGSLPAGMPPMIQITLVEANRNPFILGVNRTVKLLDGREYTDD